MTWDGSVNRSSHDASLTEAVVTHRTTLSPADCRLPYVSRMRSVTQRLSSFLWLLNSVSYCTTVCVTYVELFIGHSIALFVCWAFGQSFCSSDSGSRALVEPWVRLWMPPLMLVVMQTATEPPWRKGRQASIGICIRIVFTSFLVIDWNICNRSLNWLKLKEKK